MLYKHLGYSKMDRIAREHRRGMWTEAYHRHRHRKLIVTCLWVAGWVLLILALIVSAP